MYALLQKAFYEAMDQLPEAATIREMHKASLVDVEEKLLCMDMAFDKVEAPREVRNMLHAALRNMANMMRSH